MSNSDENLLAILGPTNTGKTYTALKNYSLTLQEYLVFP